MTAETKQKVKKSDFGINVEDMTQAGLFMGHRASRINPKMNPYLQGTRNSVHIIDLEKTQEKLIEALEFIRQLISEGKNLLIVGTKVQIKKTAKEVAEEVKLPYVTERWLGGTFTNFESIKKRVDYFKEMERKRKEGELEKYTKKERADFDKLIKSMEIKFGGIKDIQTIPEAILVLDIKKDALAVKEAREKGVKVIGIVDTNTDPTLTDYPIPANDDAVSSVKYILEKVKEVVLKAR